MIDGDMLDSHTDADDNSIVLPGSYEAGPKDSGIEHSRQKLVLAAQDHLQPQYLPSGSSSSSSTSIPVILQSVPCTEETETWSYRCKCTFQIMAVEKSGVGEDPTNNRYEEYVYAMRTQGKAVPLGSSRFPIATQRIQTAMQQLSDLVFLRSEADNPHPYSAIRQQGFLTSVTFSSSWRDTPEADCIVTLMYGRPLVDERLWKTQARDLCQAIRLRQLYGSAKKTLVAALDPSSTSSTLRDSVYLQCDSSSRKDWTVSLKAPLSSPKKNIIHVKYEKPYNAFYHPNANAMKHALQWMLHRLTWIRQAAAAADNVGGTSPPPPPRGLNLLELYCGCGAHTVALAKSGLLQNILAIELDPRLIQACHDNVQLNGLWNDDDSTCGVVQIIQGDAGTWAKKHSSKWTTTTQQYTILLVDPPRAGLDPAVCDMALMEGSSNKNNNSRFEHLLYISCGHAALLRDLERLSTTFEIVHLCQLDLFPRTDSIETLVHLQRKNQHSNTTS